MSEHFQVQTNWIVISGAPCSGKTSVLAEFALRGYKIIPEVARTLIEQGFAAGRTLAQIRDDEISFQHQVVTRKIELELSLDPKETIFLDRGLPDSLAYYRKVGVDASELFRLCAQRRYRKIFIFEKLPWHRDEARSEDRSSQELLQTLLIEAYEGLGYQTTFVPRFSLDKEESIKKRVEFVISQI